MARATRLGHRPYCHGGSLAQKFLAEMKRIGVPDAKHGPAFPFGATLCVTLPLRKSPAFARNNELAFFPSKANLSVIPQGV